MIINNLGMIFLMEQKDRLLESRSLTELFDYKIYQSYINFDEDNNSPSYSADGLLINNIKLSDKNTSNTVSSNYSIFTIFKLLGMENNKDLLDHFIKLDIETSYPGNVPMMDYFRFFYKYGNLPSENSCNFYRMMNGVLNHIGFEDQSHEERINNSKLVQYYLPFMAKNNQEFLRDKIKDFSKLLPEIQNLILPFYL